MTFKTRACLENSPPILILAPLCKNEFFGASSPKKGRVSKLVAKSHVVSTQVQSLMSHMYKTSVRPSDVAPTIQKTLQAQRTKQTGSQKKNILTSRDFPIMQNSKHNTRKKNWIAKKNSPRDFCSQLLVLGGSGGVGSFAVQLGKVLGAHVTATASQVGGL